HVGRHRIGYEVQIPLWDGDEISKRAVMAGDANGRPVRTVSWPARPAGLALPATAIDFADHTASGVRTLRRNADKLMAQHAAEAHVAVDQLQIGLANSCHEHPDSRF